MRCILITLICTSELSRLHYERRSESKGWDNILCPVKDGQYCYDTDVCHSWKVTQYSLIEFEVGCCPSVSVCLDKKICSCFQWQITGFPCCHVVAVILKQGLDFFEYVDRCFLSETYRQCYMYEIHLIPEIERFEYQSLVDIHKILPHFLKRTPERPKKKRNKSFGEFPKKKKYTTC